MVDAILQDKEPHTLSDDYWNITMTKHQEKLSVCIYKGYLDNTQLFVYNNNNQYNTLVLKQSYCFKCSDLVACRCDRQSTKQCNPVWLLTSLITAQLFNRACQRVLHSF